MSGCEALGTAAEWDLRDLSDLWGRSYKSHVSHRSHRFTALLACKARTSRIRPVAPSWLLDPSSYLLRRADSDALVLA